MISQTLRRLARATIDYPLETCLTARQRFRIGRHILDRALGENNCDAKCNGESLVMRHACRQLAGQQAVVFDIGANVGDWSLEIRQGLEDASTIYAFEPCRQTYQRLCERVAEQTTAVDVVPINAGCGDAPGHASLHVHGALAGSNSLFDRQTLRDARPQESEVVVIHQVDRFCQEHGIAAIDLMKLDVEGAELDVLHGCQHLLAEQKIGCIQFEYGGTWIDAKRFLAEAFTLLQGAGYTLGKIFPDGIAFQHAYEPCHENFQYANWLAVRDDWVSRFTRRS